MLTNLEERCLNTDAKCNGQSGPLQSQQHPLSSLCAGRLVSSTPLASFAQAG